MSTPGSRRTTPEGPSRSPGHTARRRHFGDVRDTPETHAVPDHSPPVAMGPRAKTWTLKTPFIDVSEAGLASGELGSGRPGARARSRSYGCARELRRPSWVVGADDLSNGNPKQARQERPRQRTPSLVPATFGACPANLQVVFHGMPDPMPEEQPPPPNPSRQELVQMIPGARPRRISVLSIPSTRRRSSSVQKCPTAGDPPTPTRTGSVRPRRNTLLPGEDPPTGTHLTPRAEPQTRHPSCSDRMNSAQTTPGARDRRPSVQKVPSAGDLNASVQTTPGARDRRPSIQKVPSAGDLNASVQTTPGARDRRPSVQKVPSAGDLNALRRNGSMRGRLRLGCKTLVMEKAPQSCSGPLSLASSPLSISPEAQEDRRASIDLAPDSSNGTIPAFPAASGAHRRSRSRVGPLLGPLSSPMSSGSSSPVHSPELSGARRSTPASPPARPAPAHEPHSGPDPSTSDVSPPSSGRSSGSAAASDTGAPLDAPSGETVAWLAPGAQPRHTEPGGAPWGASAVPQPSHTATPRRSRLPPGPPPLSDIVDASAEASEARRVRSPASPSPLGLPSPSGSDGNGLRHTSPTSEGPPPVPRSQAMEWITEGSAGLCSDCVAVSAWDADAPGPQQCACAPRPGAMTPPPTVAPGPDQSSEPAHSPDPSPLHSSSPSPSGSSASSFAEASFNPSQEQGRGQSKRQSPLGARALHRPGGWLLSGEWGLERLSDAASGQSGNVRGSAEAVAVQGVRQPRDLSALTLFPNKAAALGGGEISCADRSLSDDEEHFRSAVLKQLASMTLPAVAGDVAPDPELPRAPHAAGPAPHMNGDDGRPSSQASQSPSAAAQRPSAAVPWTDSQLPRGALRPSHSIRDVSVVEDGPRARGTVLGPV